jgi:uncharacterized protein with von Willebrand factor type A (vWA) domain
MVTQEGNSLIRGTIEKPPLDRDMDMLEARKASGLAGKRSEKTTCMSVVAVNEEWEHNKNETRLRNETSEPVSALRAWRNRMEHTVRQEASELTQLHQTIDRMPRIPEAHVACDEAQRLRWREWV